MLRMMWAAAIALMMCATVLLARSQAQTLPERLNPQIGPAKPRLYKAVQTAEQWKNPILIIRQQGIEVIAGGKHSEGRIVRAIDLQRTLIDLPVSAWPYGRAVAVQEIGLHPADLSDMPAIEENLKATIAILKTLAVTVDLWPSA